MQELTHIPTNYNYQIINLKKKKKLFSHDHVNKYVVINVLMGNYKILY